MILYLLACEDEPTPPPPAPEPTVVEAPAAEAPTTPAGPRVAATTDARMAASHVLVAYAGAMQALPNVTRTKEEAKARAEEVRGKLLAGAKMPDMARAYSDDSTGPRGGSLGGFGKGVMVQPFEDAVRALSAGGISPVVETPFGFHVIQRDALLEVHVKHLIVSYVGAARTPAGVTRTKEQAKARVEEAKAKVAAGEPWEDVVEAYSDGPLKENGGDMGWFTRGQLAPVLDTAAMDLDIGAASDVIESEAGFHIVFRAE
jgi:NIMA-interacting peptidyl-prolyl cis-trans isomerase 1